MKIIRYPGLVSEMAKKGETQKTIAELLGLSIPSISSRFRGKKDWSIGEIEKLCNYYGKDYYELFK